MSMEQLMGFDKLIASKMTYTMAAFLDAFDAHDQFVLDIDQVEYVYVYTGNHFIYQIREGDVWEYDTFKITSCRFVYFMATDEIIEDNDLLTLEKAVFANMTGEGHPGASLEIQLSSDTQTSEETVVHKARSITTFVCIYKVNAQYYLQIVPLRPNIYYYFFLQEKRAKSISVLQNLQILSADHLPTGGIPLNYTEQNGSGL